MESSPTTATTGYDTLGRVTSVTDPRSNTTSLSYNDLARTTTVTDPLGATQVFAFDLAGNQTAITDGLSKTWSYSYDLLGRLTTASDPLTNTTSYEYTVSGTRDAAVNARGHRTELTSDRFGRADSIVDALSGVTSYGYDRASRVTSITDPRSTTTAYAYDKLSRVTGVTEAVGYGEQRSTGYAYDAAGDLTAVTDPRGIVTRFAHDTAGRVTGVTAAYGTADALTSSFAYDTLDRVTSATAPGTRVTATAYDLLGRATSVTEGVGTALSRTTAFAYDANDNLTSVTDPLTRTTSFAYDKLNRVTSTTNPLSGVTTVAYDAAGRVTSLTDPVTNTTTFAYDAAGRRTSETDPLGKSITYTYDKNGNVTSVTDRLGRQRVFTYDALDRVTAEDWSTSGSKVQSQTFGYDANSNLTSATDPDGNYTMTYDRLDRATAVTEPFGVTLTMAYDADSNRTSVTDSLGGTQTTSYDNLNRPTARAQTGVAKVAWSYDAKGDTTGVTRYGWVSGAWQAVGSTSKSYDDLGRVTDIRHADASNTTLAHYQYAYDAGDRLTSETIDGVTRTYSYDNTDQVTSDNGVSLSYDKNGNRTNTGYTTGAGNRMTSDGTWSYTYNDEGQVTGKSKSGESWSYSYDHRGQLVSATNGTSSVSFAYDVFGNKIQRSEGTTTTRYAYDGWDTAKPMAVGNENFDAWADLDGSNALTMRRMYGGAFDEPLARQSSSGTVGWYGADRMGSVRKVFDNAGSVVASSDFDAFGNLKAGALSDRYGFTGREWDTTLGVYDYRARIYTPSAGRFFGEDPMGFAAGDANLHRYVGNGATNFTDPSGLDPDAVAMPYTGTPPPQHDPAITGAAQGGGVSSGQSFGDRLRDARDTTSVLWRDMMGGVADARGWIRRQEDALGFFGKVPGPGYGLKLTRGLLGFVEQSMDLTDRLFHGDLEGMAKSEGGFRLSMWGEGLGMYLNGPMPFIYHPGEKLKEVLQGVANDLDPAAANRGSDAWEAVDIGLQIALAFVGGGTTRATAPASNLKPLGARGPSSGRPFNPAQAGGPIRVLTTKLIQITHKGIDVIERHVARFDDDAANTAMIRRLRRIASGNLKATKYDLNFYAHELREFVRYRRLGFPDGGGGSRTRWNNAHTATLEDYRLHEFDFWRNPNLFHPNVWPLLR